MTRDDLQAALQNPNVSAFLKAIRLGEGTLDEYGYKRIVGGDVFSDYTSHPNKRIYISRYNVYSTAAGAYQIIFPTWSALCKQYDFPDFSPQSQDEAAVALVAGRHALEDVMDGHFIDAIQKCSAEWASLPGSKAQQRIENIEKIRRVYIQNGGTINEG